MGKIRKYKTENSHCMWDPAALNLTSGFLSQVTLAFMSLYQLSYVNIMVLYNLSYVAWHSPSCLFLRLQWHCPVCWTGVIWFPFLQVKDWSLRKIGDLSEVTCSLPMKFRTRSQVQCAFYPRERTWPFILDIKKYSKLFPLRFSCHSIYFYSCLISWLDV